MIDVVVVVVIVAFFVAAALLVHVLGRVTDEASAELEPELPEEITGPRSGLLPDGTGPVK
jgi:hypothetical protein